MLLVILIQEDEEGRISDRTHLSRCVIRFAFSCCRQFGQFVRGGRLSQEGNHKNEQIAVIVTR